MGVVARLAQGVEDIRIERRQLRLRIHHQAGLRDARQRGLSVRVQFELVGHRGHQPLAQQLAFAHAPAHRHRRVHQADVDAAVLQGLGLLGIAHFAQHHLHARRLAPQFAQRARQRVEQRRGHQPHRQLAGAAARDLAGALLGGVDAGHADARVLDDGQRRRRGRGAQARTLEQAHAQVLFHAAQRLAQRGLRDAQPFSGAADAAMVHHRQEITQMPGFHINPV